MKLMEKNCALCSKPDVVQKHEFCNKLIENSFFSVNKKDFKKDFVQNIRLCIICAYKVQASASLKKCYDEMCNRNNKLSAMKCFFCEFKADLIDIDEDPNNIQQKMDVFLNFVVIRHDYNHLKACLKCLYNLSIWHEIKNNLYKLMNIPEPTPLNNDAKRNTEVADTKPRPPRNSITLKEAKPKGKRGRPLSKKLRNNKAHIWREYIHKRLSNFKTVDKLLEDEDFMINIARDANTLNVDNKLFKMKPFVEIFLTSQINDKRKLRKDDVIVVSDTESNTVIEISNSKPQKLSLSLKKKMAPKRIQEQAVKHSKPKRKKNKIRVKFSLKRKNVKQNIDNGAEKSSEQNIDADTENSSESAMEIEDSDVEINYTCNICDKNFAAKCDYLLHQLKHDKLENLVINVSRDKLPPKLNLTELSPKNVKNIVSTPENINKLLRKWIGENAITDDANSMQSAEDEQKSTESEEKISKEINGKETEDEKEKDNISEIASGSKNCSPKKTTESANEEKVEDESDDQTNKTESEIEVEMSSKDNSTDESTEIVAEDQSSDKLSKDEESNVLDIHEQSTEDSDKENVDKTPDSSNKEKSQNAENDTSVIESESETLVNKSVTKECVTETQKETNVEPTNENADLNGEKGTDKDNQNLIDLDDSSNSNSARVTCNDLIKILDSDIEADNATVKDTLDSSIKKRKRDEDVEEVTPKRKKVRFAEEKEVFTPDNSGVLLERITENEQLSHDEDEQNKDDDDNEETL